MDRAHRCPLDGAEMLPAGAEAHVQRKHGHLSFTERVHLVKFLRGEES